MAGINNNISRAVSVGAVALALMAGGPAAWAAGDQTGGAATPPMGWNPYNAFGINANEANIIGEAEALVKTGLADAGYRYINVDDGWWLKRDASGRLVVRTTMFPSAAPATEGGPTSLRPFTDRLHAMGFKPGLYTDIGRNACSQAWQRKNPNLPEGTQGEREVGAMDHQAADMQQIFGDWNFDYIKVDACGPADYGPDRAWVKDGTYRAFTPIIVRDKPNPTDDAKVEALYASLKDAIAAVRPKGDYVFSICAWGEASVNDWGNKYGNLWRTSADINSSWKSMLHNFDSAAARPEKAGPGHWNDPDLLEIGNGEFDADHLTEARAHMSMWAIISAPLLLSGDVAKWPQSLVDIVGNREVIAIDQDPAGHQGTVVTKSDDGEILIKALAGGDKAVALINRSAQPLSLSVSRSRLGLAKGAVGVRDLWTHQDKPLKGDSIAVTLAPHETALYRVGVKKP